MSYHHRPEFTAPDEQRCEALVRGKKSNPYMWMKIDHRCPKTANQMRGTLSVCHVHAKTKEVICHTDRHD